MDFLSIRKKARERAEARARQEEAAAPPAADRPPPPDPGARAGAPPPPEPAPPIEDALREELSQLETAPPPPPPVAAAPQAAPAPRAPAAPEPPPAAPPPPRDPLDEFFWREDEAAPELPDLGLAAAEQPAARERAGELREHVTFLLGAEEYGVAIERVREILRPPPITEVPRAPEHVLGVVTLRGEVVPVIDPRRRLALPPAPAGPRSRIVVCETADGPVGLLVDAVSQVLRLPPGAVEPRPPGVGGAASEAISGIGREADRMVVLLHLDVLLGGQAAVGEGAA
jgi:purine-binding chemotaxis protein CheW